MSGEASLPDSQRCTARTKRCRKCGYEYPPGDKATVCPQCGTERRCRAPRYHGMAVCAQHGGRASEAAAKKRTTVGDTTKLRVAHRIYNAYSRVLAHPSLLSLSEEIAVVTAAGERLLEMIDRLDVSAAAEDIARCVAQVEQAVANDDRRAAAKAIVALRKALDPVRIEHRLWSEYRENLELQRRLVETERRYLISDEQYVPIAEVLEALIIIQRVTMRYIPNPADRAAFAAELRRMLPERRPALVDVQAKGD